MYAVRRDLKLIIGLLDRMMNQKLTPQQYSNISRRIHHHLDNDNMMSGDEYDGFFEMTNEEEGQLNQEELDEGFSESLAKSLESATDDAS